MYQTTPQTIAEYDSRIRVGNLTGFRANRRFTDLFCCLSYLLLIGACVGLVLFNQRNAVQGFEKLRDSDHNTCEKPFVFLYFPTPELDRSVCISNCPSRAGKSLNCNPNSKFPKCPESISGLVSNYELGVCHHPQAQIPLASVGRILNNAIFNSKKAILNTLGIITLIAFLIVITTLLFPSIIYLYLIIFQFIMIAIALGCFYRFFIGKLPFVDVHPQLSYKGSLYALGLGILFFIGAIISLTMLITRFPALRFTVKIINAARAVLFDNPLTLFNSMVLTLLSFGVFILNYWLYFQIQSFGFIDKNSTGLNQYKSGPVVHMLRALFLIQALWTHGFIISLSHFVSEAQSTLWYYSPVLGTDTCYSFFSTIKLIFWHFGTICFGSSYTYYSQTLTNTINRSQRFTAPADFNSCCCIHNACFKYLSVYGFIPTILEGLPFWASNNKFSPIKIAAQSSYNELYMQGSFFTNSAKFFLTVLSTLIVYVQLVTDHPEFYFHFRALVIPLLITAFVAHQIATSWLDVTGTTGDTILFNHVIETTSGQGYLRGNPLTVIILNEKVQLPMMVY